MTLTPAMARIYRFGPFRLEADTQILFRGEEPTLLGKRAVALLRALVERAGAPVSKDALIEAAWPGLAVEDSNLTVQIAAVRRILEAETGVWVETLPRRGYRYVGPSVATDAPSPRTLALPEKPSIAVLPCTILHGDPARQYFVDGMVEGITAGLSRIKGLFVVARNSGLGYGDIDVDARRAGRELGVRYLGSSQNLPERARAHHARHFLRARTNGAP
jgi:DNA-binding winged helix-turn-helix (wHTH) protein